MTTRKPASLDGSLLARKGAAMPAMPLNSPLTEELGEPRPQATVVQFEAPAANTVPPDVAPDRAPVSSSPQVRRPVRVVVAVLLVAVAAALVFAFLKFVPTPNPAAPDGAKEAAVTMAPSSDKAVGDSADKSGAEAGSGKPAATVDPVAMAGVAPNPAAPIVLAPAPPPPLVQAQVTKPVVEKNSPPTSIAAKPSAPVPARKPDSVPARPSVSPYLVQIAAVPTTAAARAEIVRLEKRLGGVLGQNRIVTVKAVGADRQTVYRLRVGGYASLSAARSACKRIRQQKIDCLVVKR